MKEKLMELIDQLEKSGYAIIAGWDIGDVRIFASAFDRTWLNLILSAFHPKDAFAAKITEGIKQITEFDAFYGNLAMTAQSKKTERK